MSAKTDRLRRAAAWSGLLLVAVGGIISAIAGSWLVVVLAASLLAINAASLISRRRARPER